MKVWIIREGYDSYDGDAGVASIFLKEEDANKARETMLRKRVASDTHPYCCEVQEWTLFESYNEWFEEAKEVWGFRTP